MKWNKAIIVIHREVEQGDLYLRYIIPEYFKPGDEILCESVNGYLEGKVHTIEDTNVPHNRTHKKVKAMSSVEAREIKEEQLMLRSIFNVVKVRHNNSERVQYVYTSQTLQIGDVVVYSTRSVPLDNKSDGYDTMIQNRLETCKNWHVGVVMDFYPKGVTSKATGSEEAFIVQAIGVRTIMHDCMTRNRALELKTQLYERQKQFEQIQLYEMLAQADPVAEKALDELKKLQGIYKEL